MTLKVDLKNYQGNVQKTASVFTNDSDQSPVTLQMKGTIKAYIELRPSNTVHFRGAFDQLVANTVDLVSVSEPFRIERVETNLADRVAYELETVEEGRHYRLRVSNKSPDGRYSGYIKCLTDHPARRELVVNVTGFIEGEISVYPLALLVGRVSADQPLRTATTNVVNNRRKAFRITRLSYDKKLIEVVEEPLTGQSGYLLKVSPRLENVPQGEHRETILEIETDVRPGAKDEVRINVLHR